MSIYLLLFSFSEQTKLIIVIQHTLYFQPWQAFQAKRAFESSYKMVMLGKITSIILCRNQLFTHCELLTSIFARDKYKPLTIFEW